jgi:FKBP-type peptidyl-prolyl cis-trans isomerase 2
MEFKMTIKDGDFIRVDYTETVDGETVATTNKDVALEKGIFDSETNYGPRLVVVGQRMVVPGLEEDLIGKEIGYSGVADLPPEKAFGVYDPEKMGTFPITLFKEEKPWPGMRVSIDNRNGVVSRIIGRKVWVDFNFPLAGKTVKYEYRILEQIEDDLDKLKSLIEIIAGIELDVKIAGEIIEIDTPWEMNYYREWILGRRKLAEMIMALMHPKEVRFIERHTAVGLGFATEEASEKRETGSLEEGSPEEGSSAGSAEENVAV